jgi:hypothetical protein
MASFSNRKAIEHPEDEQEIGEQVTAGQQAD